MNNTLEFKLGELSADVKDIRKELEYNRIDHEDIKRDLKSLNTWRWKVIGAIIGISAVVQIAVNLIYYEVK